MRRILSLLFVLIAGISLLCGGTYLFCGQELFSPQNQVQDEEIKEDEFGGDLIPTADAYWSNRGFCDVTFEGSGTSGDPYLISSSAELAGMAYLCNEGSTNDSGYYYYTRYYQLTANVDMSAHYWDCVICDGSTYFSGTFDGNGYVIYGLTFSGFQLGKEYDTEPISYDELCGMFGQTNGATMKNIILSRCYANVTAISSNDNVYFGAIVAYAKYTQFYACAVVNSGYSNSTYDIDISTSLRVRPQNNSSNVMYVGALIGVMEYNSFQEQGQGDSDVMQYCYAKTDLYVGSSNSQTSGLDGAGGLIGALTHASTADRIYIKNCFFNGHIDSYTQYTGGLIGITLGDSLGEQLNICACYYRERITAYLGREYGGGLIGWGSYLDIQSCYSCVQTMNETFNVPSGTTYYKGGLIGRVGDAVYMYRSFWYSSSSSTVSPAIAGTGSIHSQSSGNNFYNDITGPKNSDFYTSMLSTSTGAYSWNIGTTWVLGSSYLNGGYPCLNIGYTGQSSVSISKEAGGSITFQYVSVGDLSTSVSLSSTTSSQSTSTRTLRGGYILLTVTPVSGYSFSHWSVNSSTYSTSTAVVIPYDSSKTSIGAHFTRNKITIYLRYDKKSNPGGISTSSSNSVLSSYTTTTSILGRTFNCLNVTFYQYSSVTLTLSATASGYTFVGWRTSTNCVASNIVGTSLTYTISSLSASTTLWAWTNPIDRILNLDAGSGGWYTNSGQLEVTGTSTPSGCDAGFTYIEDSSNDYEGYYAAENGWITGGVYGIKITFYVPTSQTVYYTFSFPQDSEDDGESVLISNVDDSSFTWDSDSWTSQSFFANYTDSQQYDHQRGSLGTLAAGTHFITIILFTGQAYFDYQFYFRINNAWHRNGTSSYEKVICMGDSYSNLPTPSTIPTDRDFDGWYTSSVLGSGVNRTNTSTYSIYGDETLYAHYTYKVTTLVAYAWTNSTDSSAGGGFTMTYYNKNNTKCTASLSQGASLSYVQVTTRLGTSVSFTPTPGSDYVFAGASKVSASIPYTNTKSVTPTDSPMSYAYVYFVTKSDNPLKYDATGKYFYFEDGEYPQSYVGDDMNTTLNSVLASKISDTPTDSLDEYDLVLAYYGASFSFLDRTKTINITVYKYTDGNKYAKYIPTSTKTLTLSTGSVTLTSGTAYWFKVEPIRWRITAEGVTIPPTTWKNFGKTNTNFKVVSDRVISWSYYSGNSTLSPEFPFPITALINAYMQIKNLNFSATGTYQIDRVGLTGQQEKVNKDNSYSSSNPIAVSLEELESSLADNRAKASDLICVIAGIGTNDYCEYWTRDMYSNTSAYRIDKNGKEQISWMTNSYGVRFTMTMTEGQALGTSYSDYT